MGVRLDSWYWLWALIMRLSFDKLKEFSLSGALCETGILSWIELNWLLSICPFILCGGLELPSSSFAKPSIMILSFPCEVCLGWSAPSKAQVQRSRDHQDHATSFAFHIYILRLPGLSSISKSRTQAQLGSSTRFCGNCGIVMLTSTFTTPAWGQGFCCLEGPKWRG